MRLSGAIRKRIREALMGAFDREELELAMGDVDIHLTRIASGEVRFEMAVNALIDECDRNDEVQKMLEGAIAANQKNRALLEALTAYRDWQASPNAQTDQLSAGWMSPTPTSPGSNQQVGQKEGASQAPWLPVSGTDETAEPTDLPAGLPRSEWDLVWAEVWRDQWPVMLDDVKVRLWRRVARRRSAAAQGQAGQASQSPPRMPGALVRFDGKTGAQSDPMAAGPGPNTTASAHDPEQEDQHG